MGKGTLGQVVKRAISDAAFRRQLQSDPEGALKGFDLTGDERAALRSGDASKLTSLGIDQRMSKIFAASEGAVAVSKWGTGSDLSMGANVPDGGDTSVTDALVSGGGGRASDALISEASGAKGARISDAGGSTRDALGDQHDGGRSAIGDSAAGGRTALDDQTGMVRNARISDAGGSTRDALGDQHDGGRAAIGDNASGGRTALDNSATASREGAAYITADEQGNNVVADGSAGAQSSLDVSGNTRDTSASIDTSAAAGRGDAYISANEWSPGEGAQSSLDVSGQTRGDAFVTADETGAQSSLDTSGWQTRDANLGVSDAAGRQTDAFLTADELGNDVVASGTGDAGLQARIVDSADVQREALDAGTSMANPEGYDQPDPNAA